MHPIYEYIYTGLYIYYYVLATVYTIQLEWENPTTEKFFTRKFYAFTIDIHVMLAIG